MILEWCRCLFSLNLVEYFLSVNGDETFDLIIKFMYVEKRIILVLQSSGSVKGLKHA